MVISLKHLGALAVIILVFGLSFVALQWPRGKHATFSQHVAVHKHAVLFYNLLFTISLPLLIVFFTGWFVPTRHLSLWFTVSIVAASILQYIVTVIPEIGGWKTRLHRILAGLSALFLLPPVVMLLFLQPSNAIVQLVILASLLMMTSIIAVISINQAKHSHLLFLQAGYFTAFFLAIMVATYL
jgi:hypothetical protein